MPKEETEEYLEAILDLSADGSAVKTTELAGRLKVSPASVTGALQRLADAGMVDYEPYKGASLSARGLERASRIKRKHRLLEVFLTKILHMRPERAHEDACKLEHSLSDEAEEALCRNLKGPDSCPSGRPIPPCDADVASCAQCLAESEPPGRKARQTAVPLTSLSPKENARVVFVRGGNAVVKRLCDLGLTPGASVSIERSAPMKGPVEVLVRGCHLALGRGIADKIFVRSQGRGT